MATSFAALASQYLNKNQESSNGSSQPMFFSFTTDDGSRTGEDSGRRGRHRDSADLLDDGDDPHLRGDDREYGGEEEYDPYLRLDEDEERVIGGPSTYSRYHHQNQPARESIRLVSSASTSPISPSGRGGWLAHQATTPSLPASSGDDESDSRRSSSDEGISSPPRGTRGPPMLSMTESLLPRDGSTRPIDVFSLPDPRHTSRSRWKYNDPLWTPFYLTSLTLCVFGSFLSLFLARPEDGPRGQSPYSVLLHTVPLLTILTFSSATVAYAHVWLLRIFVRPVMVATSVFIPATLLVSSLWAFIGSFMWEEGKEPTWGESTGLRLFSLIPLVLAIITGRRLLDLPRQLHTTSSLLDITTHVLQANPFLLLLSPALLLGVLLLAIPLTTLAFRLLLVGWWSKAESGLEWHVKSWAHWAIAGTAATALWTWGVARGILRVTTAGVIGAWYFADPSKPPPNPQSTHTIHAALTRATQPSLGTVVLSALLLTLVRLLALLVTGLRALPYYLPIPATASPAYLLLVRPLLTGASVLAAYLENGTSTMSTYALIYVGLTGDEFFRSARRVRALVANVDAHSSPSSGYRRRFRTEPQLAILTVAPLTLAFPFALITYLFVAHTLGSPSSALGASLLAGAVTSLVGAFCIGVLRDSADTLYVCYCVDKDVGARHREVVFRAFEYDAPTQPATAAHPPPPSHQTPTHTLPTSPPRRSVPLRAQHVQSSSSSGGDSSPPPRPAVPRAAVSPPDTARPQPRSRERKEELPSRQESSDIDPFVADSEANLREHEQDHDMGPPHVHEGEEEEEEQMFPGSDLF